jgi:hypothetical protein
MLAFASRHGPARRVEEPECALSMAADVLLFAQTNARLKSAKIIPLHSNGNKIWRSMRIFLLFLANGALDVIHL